MPIKQATGQATQEEAAALLEAAGVPLVGPSEERSLYTRVEICRRLLEMYAEFTDGPVRWGSRETDTEDLEFLLYPEIERRFGVGPWHLLKEGATFGDLVLWVEAALCEEWRSLVGDALNPCGTQTAFYDLRRMLRAGGATGALRPSTRLRDCFPRPQAGWTLENAAHFRYRIGDTFGPELRIFGLPFLTFGRAWLALAAVYLFFLCKFLPLSIDFLGSFLLGGTVLAFLLCFFLRAVWTGNATLADITRQIVAKIPERREKLIRAVAEGI